MKSNKKLQDILAEERARYLNIEVPKTGRIQNFFNVLSDKLKILRSDLYDIKVPLTCAITASGADRTLTYLALKTSEFYEANPLNAYAISSLSIAPALILGGAYSIGSYAMTGKVIEKLVKIDIPRNNFVKAFLYGTAASEAVLALNNYVTLYAPNHINMLNTLLNNSGFDAVESVLLGISLLPAAAYGLYLIVKNWKDAKPAKTNRNGIYHIEPYKPVTF